LVLTAQAIFLLQHGQTDATERPTHASGYAGVGNKVIYIFHYLCVAALSSGNMTDYCVREAMF